jgi:hypothetical protein
MSDFGKEGLRTVRSAEHGKFLARNGPPDRAGDFQFGDVRDLFFALGNLVFAHQP